jgi:hypothetical protein
VSSFTRTLQKRALKSMGFHRIRSEVRTMPTSGTPYVYSFPKGQRPITAPDGTRIGLRWPVL